MKRLLFASAIVIAAVGAGCNTTEIEPSTVDILSQDITGDGVDEVVTIVTSDIEIDPVFAEVYPHVFTELHIKDGDANILSVNDAGIGVEDGEMIPATIPDSTTYAMQLGDTDFMYVVQLDSAGAIASEPLTINFDTETQEWIMGK